VATTRTLDARRAFRRAGRLTPAAPKCSAGEISASGLSSFRPEDEARASALLGRWRFAGRLSSRTSLAARTYEFDTAERLPERPSVGEAWTMLYRNSRGHALFMQLKNTPLATSAAGGPTLGRQVSGRRDVRRLVPELGAGQGLLDASCARVRQSRAPAPAHSSGSRRSPVRAVPQGPARPIRERPTDSLEPGPKPSDVKSQPRLRRSLCIK
jgi:hypothetical protein